MKVGKSLLPVDSVNIQFTKRMYPLSGESNPIAFDSEQDNILMSKILIVDDDSHIRELVRVFLNREGFEVLEASDGVEAIAKLDAVKVDCAVIDVMMPNMDGWELCRELKATFDIPILMLTARGETSQKLKVFQLGTDDYLVKPFDPLELVARVHALLKRYRIIASQTVQVGELFMDRKTFELSVDGERLTLPLKEFELQFNRLMQNRTTVIIAHRLSTIKVAYHIAVLDGGRIVELGTHKELMEKNGLYARLYSMQFRNPEDELAAFRSVLSLKDSPQNERKPEESTGLFNAILRRG